MKMAALAVSFVTKAETRLPNDDVSLRVHDDGVILGTAAVLAKERVRDQVEKHISEQSSRCKRDHSVER